jgi:hypothetical protein
VVQIPGDRFKSFEPEPGAERLNPKTSFELVERESGPGCIDLSPAQRAEMGYSFGFGFRALISKGHLKSKLERSESLPVWKTVPRAAGL